VRHGSLARVGRDAEYGLTRHAGSLGDMGGGDVLEAHGRREYADAERSGGGTCGAKTSMPCPGALKRRGFVCSQR